MKITIKELSDYCLISAEEEERLQSLISFNTVPDENIVQAMVNFILEYIDHPNDY